MKYLKNFFYLIFFSLTINFLKAEEKVSILILIILTNTVAGKELLNNLKKKKN